MQVGRRAAETGRRFFSDKVDIPDEGAIHAACTEVRERGCSIDREETVTGIAGFAFALRYDVPAADAVSCSVPVARLTPDHEVRIVSVMREIRAKIETHVPPALTRGSRARAGGGVVQPSARTGSRHPGRGKWQV